MAGKARCKAALQRRLQLADRADVPLFAVVSRLVEQKGIDLLVRSAEALLRENLQLVVLGTGDPGLQAAIQSLGNRHPGRVSAQFGFDNGLAHQIMAGSDALLLPSRYEPCGLTQLYALRYGTIPVVRSTGGLVDTVEAGVTGIRFDHYTPEGLEWAVRETLGAYREPARWLRIQRAGMDRDFSWDASAREYARLYRSLVAPEPVSPDAPPPGTKKTSKRAGRAK